MDGMETADYDMIKSGDYVIIQRQKYTKLHKFSGSAAATLGKDHINLANINGERYFTTFKMLLSECSKKRIYDLEPCPDFKINIINEISVAESGDDNRNIVDNGQSQQLTAEQIDELKGSGKTSTEIVAEIVENSKSFANKTEFSQEKYLRKKEKKYFEYIQIRKPTLRLIAEIYYRQDPEKIMGIRMDSLSQILTYSNVSCFSKCLLYESGTNGLILAALLSRMGPVVDDDDSGKLVYMHPGNFPQKTAALALNLSEDRLVAVNIYSVLRHYYQKRETSQEITEPELKKIKIDDDTENTNNGNKKKWELDNEKGSELLTNKMDSLVIVAKEEPMTILRNLLPFMKRSSPVVIYSQFREVLMDCYNEIKMNSSINVTDLHIYSSFQRNYQVLPDRTHPDINMSGNSGFILTGTTIE